MIWRLGESWICDGIPFAYMYNFISLYEWTSHQVVAKTRRHQDGSTSDLPRMEVESDNYKLSQHQLVNTTEVSDSE
jgi:hypothetical protein